MPKRTASAKAVAAKATPKVRGKAKARPGAKAKASAGAHAAPLPKAAAASASAAIPKGRAPGSSSQSARPLRRWNTDMAVDRIIKLKLSSFDHDEVNFRTGLYSGKTVREWLGDQVRSDRVNHQYITQEAWDAFFQEFPMISSRFRDLKSANDPDVDEQVADELLGAMAMTSDENPVARRPDAVVNYLQYCKHMNVTSMKLIFIHSREGPHMTMKNSHKQSIALLRLCGKKDYHKLFPFLWQKVIHDLDDIFSQHVASQVVSSTLRDEWIRANTSCMAPLVDIAAVLKIEEALGRKQCAPLEALKSVLSTKTGKILYSDEAASLAYLSFLERIDNNIYELEMQHFNDSDWTNFESVMYQDVCFLQFMIVISKLF